MEELLIGIDWSQNHHDVRVLNERGASLLRFRFPHSPAGLATFEKQLAPFNLPPNQCLVAIETIHNLLVDFLWAHQYQVYFVPPSVVHAARGRLTSSGAVTDDRSAFLLADLLRTDRHRLTPWKPDGPLVIQMRAKLSLIDSLSQSITRYANRLYAVLQRYYPQACTLFSDLQTPIALHFIIAYPSPHQAHKLPFPEFVSFCKKHHYPATRRLPDLYARLAAPPLEPAQAVLLAYQDEATFLAQLLLDLLEHKAQTLGEVRSLFVQHPDAPIFASLPGAGALLEPKLLVMFGDHRDRFPSPAAIQALAGTCPVTEQSGKSRHVRFRKACNHDYRNTAQQFAMESVAHSAWAASYLSEALERGMSKNQAYRCLANRWLAIIWHLWQHRQPYDEAYHLSQVRQHRNR